MTTKPKPKKRPARKQSRRKRPFDYGRHKDEWGSLYWPLAIAWMAAGMAMTAAAISVLMVGWSVLT